MVNLWDKPLPGPNDYTQEPVFEAVGRVCTAWEILETSFAGLLSVLEGLPYTEAALLRYGRSARSNTARLAHLESHAVRYFCAHCSQDNEGEFALIVTTARRLIVRRNQIVHGVLSGLVVVTGKNESGDWDREIAWHISSPMHCDEPLQKGEGRYYYGSAALLTFCERFIDFAQRVSRLADALRSPST